MGILDLLGYGQSPFSSVQHALSRADIRTLVSRTAVRTLSAHEETAIEEAIDRARKGDGRISLHQIDAALRTLERTHTISVNDRNGIMQQFEKYFERFGAK